MVFVSRNVFEFEGEEKDGSDPSIDGRAGLNIRIAEHTFDELGVHLDYEIVDSDKMKAKGTQGTKKSIKFELGLGVAGLALTPGDGSETGRAAATIRALLREDPPDSSVGRVNCEIDGTMR